MVNGAAEKLRLWRIGEGLTQAQAGKRFHVTRMTWFRWENGESPPRGSAIEELCAVIAGLQPNDFYNLRASAPLREPERRAA